MAENSGISWTDNTFNPWMGCTKVSPACKHCYAERDMDHRYGKVAWGPMGTRVLTSDANWKKPLKWDREAAESGKRLRVFCASLADIFEDWQGPMVDHKGNELFKCYCGSLRYLDGSCGGCGKLPHGGPVTMRDVRQQLFKLIDATPNLDWLLLTKRPENIRAKWHPFDWQTPNDVPHRKNVWLGTSVESSDYLSRIDSLKASGGLASVLFISAEPVVGAMPTLGEYLGGIDWVIAGGESGPGSRPSNPDWFRSMRDQCEIHNVPFHFKQWGEWAPYSELTYDICKHVDTHAFDEESNVFRVGVKQAGRLLDGVLHDAFPQVPTLAEWLEGWEANVEAGQSTISRDEAERRYYEKYPSDDEPY